MLLRHNQQSSIALNIESWDDLLALQPDYASIARAEIGKLFDPELIEHLFDGLRKAGLEIAEAN